MNWHHYQERNPVADNMDSISEGDVPNNTEDSESQSDRYVQTPETN